MPTFFNLRELLEAISEERLPITDRLEEICNDQKKREQYADRIREPHSFRGAFPGWLRNELTSPNIDIGAAEAWPPSEKERIRNEVSQAVDDGRPVHFGWELEPKGRAPVVDVRHDARGDVVLVFVVPSKLLSVADDGSISMKLKRR